MELDTINKNDFFYGILHNPKTAGTALKYMIGAGRRLNPDLKVICFDHTMTYPLFIKSFPNA